MNDIDSTILHEMTDGFQPSNTQVDRTRDHVEAIMRTDPSPARLGARTRLQMPVRVVLIASALAVLAAGVSVAADRGILFSNKPTQERLHVLDADAPSSNVISEAERGQYSVLNWPVPGDADQSGARVLLRYRDQNNSLDLVAVPKSDGDLCAGLTGASRAGQDVQENLVCGGMSPSWPLMEVRRGMGASTKYFWGIAADEVADVRFANANESYPATMGANSYFWVPPSGAQVDAVEVEFTDGSIARRELVQGFAPRKRAEATIVRGATK